jgi:hypothetical protein
VQDLSRQAQTWGTEMPVVLEDDAFRQTIHLLDVPVSKEFRSLLRVYDFGPSRDVPKTVRYRVFEARTAVYNPVRWPVAPDRLLASGVMQLRVANLGFHPGYVALPLDHLDLDVERVRVEIEPQDQDGRLWAFISVTNNTTQHVTTVVPQKLGHATP